MSHEISGLPQAGTLGGDDLVIVNQDGVTRRATVAQVAGEEVDDVRVGYEYTHGVSETIQPPSQYTWLELPITSENHDDDSLGSVASNIITLEAGTYRCLAYASFRKVNSFYFRLYNVTDSVEVGLSCNGYARNNRDAISSTVLCTAFTITSQKDLKFEYFVSYVGESTRTLGSGNAVLSDFYIMSAQFMRLPE